MKLDRNEIICRLLQIDKDMSLIDSSDDRFFCVIVGGGALVLMKKIYRSTHDIDAIKVSDKIKPLLESYNINMNVEAYCTNFPDGYLNRVVKVDIETAKVDFYTVSLEDLVVSKLCSMRSKDIEDIENELVYTELDWDKLDKLVEDTCYGMLADFDVVALKENYNNYKEKFK